MPSDAFFLLSDCFLLIFAGPCELWSCFVCLLFKQYWFIYKWKEMEMGYNGGENSDLRPCTQKRKQWSTIPAFLYPTSSNHKLLSSYFLSQPHKHTPIKSAKNNNNKIKQKNALSSVYEPGKDRKRCHPMVDFQIIFF